MTFMQFIIEPFIWSLHVLYRRPFMVYKIWFSENMELPLEEEKTSFLFIVPTPKLQFCADIVFLLIFFFNIK